MVKLLVLVNLLVLISRPQDVIPVIGATKIPLILSLFAIPLTIAGIGKVIANTQQRAMLFFLLVGILMVPLAHNNFLAYHAARDLMMQFIAYFFPLFLVFSAGRDIRKLIDRIILVGCYFAIWGLTHGGTGPGGFLGDENDLGLAMLAILGFPLLALEEVKGGRRTFYLIAVVLMLAGTVATASRGAFVGMSMLAAFGLLQSTKKAKILGIAFVIVLAGLPFVPSDYWDDMGSIGDMEESTTDKRIQMWKIATRVWLHPPHFLAGAGMNNVPILLGDFEPKINQSSRGKSFAGRAVHSALFQLLPDLGLMGFLCFATIVWSCFFGNRAQVKKCLNSGKLLKERQQEILRHAQRKYQQIENIERETEVPIELTNPDEDSGKEVTAGAAVRLLTHSAEEIAKVRTLLLGAIASLVGVLSAGLFVSALYYPSFWMVFTICAILQRYAAALNDNAANLMASFVLDEPLESDSLPS
jgi:hypothetical protein